MFSAPIQWAMLLSGSLLLIGFSAPAIAARAPARTPCPASSPAFLHPCPPSEPTNHANAENGPRTMRILESGSGENGSGENGSGPPMTPPPPPTRLTYDGMAMYVGPLKGCTVFADANGDGVHDTGALRTDTDR